MEMSKTIVILFKNLANYTKGWTSLWLVSLTKDKMASICILNIIDCYLVVCAL
jgi:hypothetical protein